MLKEIFIFVNISLFQKIIEISFCCFKKLFANKIFEDNLQK